MPNAARPPVLAVARSRRQRGRTEAARLRLAVRLLAAGLDLRAVARRVGIARCRLRRKIAQDPRLCELLRRLRAGASSGRP
jgi:hypothetical protein